jgi:hypothetical protein
VFAVTNFQLYNFSVLSFLIGLETRCLKHKPIAEETRFGRLEIRTLCVAVSLRVGIQVQLDQNSLAYEMRTRGNERVSVKQGYGYGCRYGTLNEANLLKTARTCCSLEA